MSSNSRENKEHQLFIEKRLILVTDDCFLQKNIKIVSRLTELSKHRRLIVFILSFFLFLEKFQKSVWGWGRGLNFKQAFCLFNQIQKRCLYSLLASICYFHRKTFFFFFFIVFRNIFFYCQMYLSFFFEISVEEINYRIIYTLKIFILIVLSTLQNLSNGEF